MSVIVSQWQWLAAMDRQSPDFLPLLSFLIAKDKRSLTAGLRGDDAGVTLGLIDEVLGGGRIPGEYEADAIITMRMLAYHSGQVPPRYQVDRQSLSVELLVIANGAFADVRAGRLGDKTVAVRTLRADRKTDNHEAQKRFCKECIIWMNISHPNLLKLIAVDINPLTDGYSMISEMMTNGNIKEYIRKNSTNRHRLLEEAAAGLHYLHKHGIVHGDLKGQNILINNETPPRACLADFGLSTLTPGAQGEMTTVTAGGTLIFMAPELLSPAVFGRRNSRPTQPADIYALGMVIYEVLTGFQPFHEGKWHEYELVYHVVTGVRPTKPADAENIGFGDGTWELVEGCWVAESTRRPTIEQVLAHLKRVAAYSKVVGPAPDRPGESTANSVLSDHSGHPQLFLSTSDDMHTTVVTDSPYQMADTASITSIIVPVPSSNIKGSHSKFKIPTIKLPFQRSFLATRVCVDPNTVKSIIPMPIPFAITQKSGRLWWNKPRERTINSAVSKPSGPIQLFLSTMTTVWGGETTATSVAQPELWEADLAAFLHARSGWNIVTQKRQAQKFIDRLDTALDNRDLPGWKRKRYQKSLRKLCGDFYVLPSSFALAPKSIKCEVNPFASGGFSKVYKATFKGRPVAVKTLEIKPAVDSEKVHKLLVKEVVGWKWLQHENILPFLGVTSTTPPVSIVSERMENGNIIDFIRAHPNLNRPDLLIGAVTGLEYLHKHDIVHGDLKGANILIDSNRCARLADFGLAVIIEESTAGSTADCGEMKGTTRWMAPELFYPEKYGFTGELKKKLPTKSTDVYAFGMTILEVITGCCPFNDIARRETVIFKVIQGERPDRPSSGFSDALWGLLARTWDTEDSPESRKRPSTSIIRDQLREDANEWGKSIIPLSPNSWQKGMTSSNGMSTWTEENN